jgi:hypothetical protein
MEMHKALHEKIEGALAKDHPIMKAHSAMIDHCEKCMKAAKDAIDGEEPQEEDKDKDGEKALQAQIDGLEKSLKDLTEKLSKTAAPGQAASGAAAATTDASPFAELTAAPAAAR